MNSLRLDEECLLAAVATLCAGDKDLARVTSAYGPPPLWAREPGFATLVHIILEQQVSLASANAAFKKLQETVSPLTPEKFLTLETHTLRGVGFSRQKTLYTRILAESILSGALDLDALSQMYDDEVRSQLMQIKGIGRWTADIYLMEVLLRPDIWPTGDLALANAVHRVKRMEERPSASDLSDIGEQWRPWRAVAARIFWHEYLSCDS